MGADDHPTVTPGEADPEDPEDSEDSDDEAEDDGGEA